jgi:hypothetical protein
MPTAVWTGTLSFGLVAVPVRLIPATEPKDVRFHLYDRSGRRVRYERVVEGSKPAEPAGPQAFGPDEAEPETGAATSSPQPNASEHAERRTRGSGRRAARLGAWTHSVPLPRPSCSMP